MTMIRCTPIIPVSDLDHAAAWFTRCLGMKTEDMGGSVHLSRDAVHIRLVRKAPDMDMDDPRRQQSIYINVPDVGAFCATHGSEMARDNKVRPPFDRDYGAREIHIIYESLLIFIGQPIHQQEVT